VGFVKYSFRRPLGGTNFLALGPAFQPRFDSTPAELGGLRTKPWNRLSAISGARILLGGIRWVLETTSWGLVAAV